MVITSPELALSTKSCIESPGWTMNSSAAPIPEINIKMRKAISEKVNLFLISNSSVYSRNWGRNLYYG